MVNRDDRCLLKQLLEERHTTQIELSQITNIPRQRISDYANNRVMMNYMTARTIAKALRCKMEDLYSCTEQDE